MNGMVYDSRVEVSLKLQLTLPSPTSRTSTEIIAFELH